jgi:hypothetical protein
LAQQTRTKERLDIQRKKYAEAQRKLRVKEKAERAKRCQLIGQCMDEAGLLALSDTDLVALIHALAPLAHVPEPACVLEALLSDADVAAMRVGGNGCAHPCRDGVSAVR